MIALMNLITFGLLIALGFAVKAIQANVSFEAGIAGCLGWIAMIVFWQERHRHCYGFHFDPPTIDQETGTDVSPLPKLIGSDRSPTADALIILGCMALALPGVANFAPVTWYTVYAAFFTGAFGGMTIYAVAHRSRYGTWFLPRTRHIAGREE